MIANRLNRYRIWSLAIASNFGRRPSLTGTSSGSASTPNIVVGVTSWGYINNAVKEQGASPFTNNNIGVLATILCGGNPNPC